MAEVTTTDDTAEAEAAAAPRGASLLNRLAWDVEEAAWLISTTPSHLRNAVTARRIRHTRLGGERGVRFTREHLMEYLARNEVEPQQ